MYDLLDDATDEPMADVVRWERLGTAEGGYLDYQLVSAGPRYRRRLLVIEMDAAAEGRIPDAIAVLAGRIPND